MKLNNVFHVSIKAKDPSDNVVKISVLNQIYGRENQRKVVMRQKSLIDLIQYRKTKTANPFKIPSVVIPAIPRV